MIIDVRPRSRVSKARSMRISVGRSMFDVASSRIRIRGSARAPARSRSAGARPPRARAALADDVLEAHLEARRDPVDADRPRRRHDLFVGRFRAAEADVVGDRAAEEERVLQDDPELAAVGAELDVAEVGPVDADRALGGS